ncbi:hypothetical protein C8R46DRAFT_880466 [Mycena filopes]|nr:hypothetical protein C8R46DRAFT_880466 [Mycena filopes]
MNPKHKIQLGPGFNLFARAVRESLPGTQTQKSKEELRAARDIASKFQFDLECLQKERDALKKRVSELEEGEQKARRQLHISQANESRPPDLAADLETVTRGLQDCKEQLSDSRQATARLKSACERLHFKNEELQSTNKELQGGISKARERIEVLTRENNALGSQLKSRRHSQAKNQDPSIDVFSSRLDQVSEASVKSGVESLNDTLDSFVMEIMDKAEQLVDKHAHLARRPSDRDRRDNAPPLLCALAQPSLTDENRGLLLDAQLHDQLNTELHELFFSNDVISSRMESNGIVQAISEELLRREPWTVVQRWRAITAMGVFALMNESHFAQSTAHQAENIIGLIAQTHGLTPTQFEDMSDSLSSGLRALYKEANELSVVVKRDVLSVRMTITSVVATRFDPTAAASVWPEMGAVAGDEIVGRYKFGLMKRTENGERFDLIKPEVATTALIREICKNS